MDGFILTAKVPQHGFRYFLEIIFRGAEHFCKAFTQDAAEECTCRNSAEIRKEAAVLLNRHGGSILRCAYTYLHNRSDAEDILQDTLIQYLKVQPVFKGEKHERAWLLRVTANLSKNKLRYNALRKTDELTEELRGEAGKYCLAVWSEGSFTWSLQLSKAVGEEMWQKILSSFPA